MICFQPTSHGSGPHPLAQLPVTRNIVEQFWKNEHYKRGYQLVYTPHIASMDMFVKSRHLSKYINSMFPVMLHEYIEERVPDYQVDEILKLMNCPTISRFSNTDRGATASCRFASESLGRYTAMNAQESSMA